MSPKTIGILAGMGPRSTAPFVDMVITECQRQYGAKDNQDFPHMMIYSLPTPIFVDRPTDHEKVATEIETGLQRLEGTGVDFIAMPCNSAHAYYPRLAASIQVPLLNIIDEACASLQHFQRIAICATEITVNTGVYQDGIVKAGKGFVPNEPYQENVTRLIAGIIAGRAIGDLRLLWTSIVDAAMAQGADALLVACTELNALGKLEDHRIGIVDATSALARATVRRYRQGLENPLAAD